LISFDTNVLVRLIVQDNLDQAAMAEQRYRAAAEAGEPIFLCDVVLVELVWVLGVTYRASRSEIVEALQSLLDDPVFVFQNRGTVQKGLDSYRQTNADFADHLIGFHAKTHGARTVYTFDRKLSREEGFSLPSP
jgi:predicted nucleic-acid-binding protein